MNEIVINTAQVGAVSGMQIFIATFLFVLLAEMGDKTQLLVMAFTTKYKLRQVFIGVTLSIILLNVLAVALGSVITTIIPMIYIQLLAALAFIVFGILSFKKEEGEEEHKSKPSRFGPTLAVAVSFFVAELGDKTQLATMALAAKYNAPVQVLIGSVLAMIIADMIGMVAGVAVNKYIPQKYIKIAAGIIFIAFGVIGLASLIPTQYLSNLLDSLAFIIGSIALLVILALTIGVRLKRIKQ